MQASTTLAVTTMAAGQHGAIGTQQLRTAGVSACVQRAMEGAGWVRVVQPSVLVIAGSPDTWLQRLHVGLLARRGAGWVSHEAAAGLHRLDRSPVDAVAFTVPRSARGVARGIEVHTTTCVGRLDVVRVAGLPCTSATRRHVARVDFLFAEHGIVVEVSGRLGHSTPAERARDAQRRNELTDLGLRVYEFTWAQVTERPSEVIAAMCERLSAAPPSFMSRGSA